MTPDGTGGTLFDQLGRAVHTFKPLPAQTPTPDWLLAELTCAWRDAQAEATAAYEHWHCAPGPDAYTVYLASQDRADAAQRTLQLAFAPAVARAIGGRSRTRSE
jgi:hypothetical protein